MLITTLQPNGYLAVSFIYCQEYIDRIKCVQGAFYNDYLKCWLVPISSFNQYEKIFYDEIVYNTPRWKITGESPPDYSKLYYVNPNIHAPKMKLNPFPYQDYGIRFMLDRLSNNKFVLNSDKMGLGKTIQAIGTFQYLMQYCGLQRVLIICKKSIKSQWVSEIDKFTNISKKMPVEYTSDKKSKRQELYERLSKYNSFVLVCNYDICINDLDYLLKMNFQLVVIDEVHILRNRNGKKNKAIAKVCSKASSVIFLTGTPIQNRPEDLYGIIKIADGNFFGKWEDYKKTFIKYDKNSRYEKSVGIKNISKLKQKIQPYYISRTVDEVGIQMPAVVEKKILVQKDSLQIKILDVIDQEKKKVQSRLDAMYSKRNVPGFIDKYKALEGSLKGLISHEQVVADDPRIFLMSKSQSVINKYGVLVPKNYKGSSKTEALLEIVEDIVSSGEKVIIFSKFSRAVRLIKTSIENKYNIKVNIVTGGASMSDDEKNKRIEEFKFSSDVNVLVATNTLAEGVNLQQARHQINYDQPDSDAIKRQMAGRVRRVGSKYSNVYTYDFITEGSKDEERYENIHKTSTLASSIVGIDEEQKRILKQLSNN